MSTQAEIDARDAVDVLEQIERAIKEGAALNHGQKWRMTIPVDVEDSDVVIIGALVAARKEIIGLRGPAPQEGPRPMDGAR